VAPHAQRLVSDQITGKSEPDIFWDGIFHSGTYVLMLIGLFILWRTAHRLHLIWSNALLVGSVLMGWRIFNLVEGILDHALLGVHHVNELVDPSHRLWPCPDRALFLDSVKS
jgi:uncharacterized membrane protein